MALHGGEDLSYFLHLLELLVLALPILLDRSSLLHDLLPLGEGLERFVGSFSLPLPLLKLPLRSGAGSSERLVTTNHGS